MSVMIHLTGALRCTNEKRILGILAFPGAINKYHLGNYLRAREVYYMAFLGIKIKCTLFGILKRRMEGMIQKN